MKPTFSACNTFGRFLYLRIAALAARSLFFLLVMVCFLYAMSGVRVMGVSEWFFAAVKRVRLANWA